MTGTSAHTQESRLRAIAELAPAFRARAREADDNAAFPAENFADLRARGLVALTAPEALGGHGLWSEGAFTPYYELIEALACVDTCTAQLLQVHSHALGFLSRHGTAAQHERFLTEIVAQGQLLASVGSETAPTGNAPGVYTSELVPDGDGWRLTCKKFFASLAPSADWLLLWVALPGDEPYTERTVTVLVPREAPEVTLVDDWDVMGMRPTVSWGVHVDDMYISPEHVIGAPGAWVRDDPRTFSLAFAANHAGIARAALEFAIDWVGRALPRRLRPRAARDRHARGRGARRPERGHGRRRHLGRGPLRAGRDGVADGRPRRQAGGARRDPAGLRHLRRAHVVPPLPARDLVPRRPHAHVARARRRADARARPGLLREGSSVKAALDTSVLPQHNA